MTYFSIIYVLNQYIMYISPNKTNYYLYPFDLAVLVNELMSIRKKKEEKEHEQTRGMRIDKPTTFKYNDTTDQAALIASL